MCPSRRRGGVRDAARPPHGNGCRATHVSRVDAGGASHRAAHPRAARAAAPAFADDPTLAKTNASDAGRKVYDFEQADIESLLDWFNVCERESSRLIEASLPLPAYEMALKASHTFNLLDARNAISVTERQRFILRVRNLARLVAETYYASREELGFPGVKESGSE